MKIDAVGVTTSNLRQSVNFYSLLGFVFPEFKDDEGHLEPLTSDSSARLMIDTKKMVEDILGEKPKPANHSCFAIRFDTPGELDTCAGRLKEAGFKIVKEPWNAFWGQRYAIIEDPDGYKIDLYARI